MVEKVTKMLIKVDLQCSRCCKKIKKLLCKYPQIRDQIYDEKQNEVSITVVCCSPEKIRDKIVCKGGKTVKSVEILPDKPKAPKPLPRPPTKETSTQTEEAEQPQPPPPPPPPPPDGAVEKPVEPLGAKAPEMPNVVIVESPKEPTKLPAPASALPSPKVQEPVAGCPLVPMIPRAGVCCCPRYGGYGGGPCYYHGQGRSVMCYDGCGRPARECQCGNRSYYMSQCDFFGEENPTGCTVM